MNTKALRQKILDLAIHGKLVPQDPNDEPASVLLERIKAEKERLIKEGKIKRTKRSKAACDKPHYPYELPKGWCWTKLSEITSIIGDGLHGTPQYDSSGNYYFINGNNLANRKIVIKEETKKISYDEYIKYRKPLNESTIFVSINGTIGNVGTYNGEKVILGKSACFFNLLPFLFKEYICSIIESDYFRKYALKSATGSTIKNVPLKAINDFYIPIAPLQEQMRIVGSIKLWLSLVNSIEENKDNLQDTIKQAKSKILDLAIHGKLVPQDPTDEPASELLKRINPKAEITCDTPHYRKLPKGWVIAHLSNIAEIKNGYAFKSSNYISSNGIRIIRIANVQDGFIEDKTPQYYPKESCDDIENFFLKEKDLLMSLTGNVGRVGLLPKSFLPAALNQRVACIRENELLIDKEYLCYLFQSNEFQRKCIKSAKGVAQLNISTEWLKCYQIPIPPMAEQKRIVETISLLFANLRMIEASL